MAHKEIKAVEMTRQIREQHYRRLLNLSPAERLAFYREQARLINAKAAQLLKKRGRKRIRA